MINFSISEFCIAKDPVPQDVADKILKYHIVPLQACRGRINQPIVISDHSGYRPVAHELKKKRSGNSQHCFKRKGAVDLIYTKELLADLKEYSHYTRICYYVNKGFIHCDYKDLIRNYFEDFSDGDGWDYKETLKS